MLRDGSTNRSYVLSLGATAGAAALCGAYQESHHDVSCLLYSGRPTGPCMSRDKANVLGGWGVRGRR